MTVKKQQNDLDAFKPSPPEHRLDDKAASLEEEIQELKREFKREKFTYIFAANFFLLLFISSVGNSATLTLSVIVSLMFQIAMAKWLDFPWITRNLERWHELVFQWGSKKVNGEEDNTEPLPHSEKNKTEK